VGADNGSMPRAAHAALLMTALTLAACNSDPEVPAGGAAAVAVDRPLDGTQLAAESKAARTAALVEAALAQVTAADLRRCLSDYLGETIVADARVPVRQHAWLIVAAAQPASGAVFALRREVAPELNPMPADDWQDRVTYRTLLRSPNPADGSVACLSCVFDYESGTIAYRHAYALDTCPSTVPGERELATKAPVG
jgi:hypothetical protein